MTKITRFVNVTMFQIFESSYIHVCHTRYNSRNSLKYITIIKCVSTFNMEHNLPINVKKVIIGAMFMASSGVRTRHIDTHVHNVRDNLEEGIMNNESFKSIKNDFNIS
jgi:hypothetical protein